MKRLALAAAALIGSGVALCATTTAQGQIVAPYIVVLSDDVDGDATTAALERSHGFTATHRYSVSLKGFAATLASRQRDAIARDIAVASIHADRPLALPRPSRSAANASLSTGVKRIGGGAHAADGVAVAVLDTGVDLAHPALHALAGTNCVGGANRRATAVSDGNGHGTHVAGTISGTGGIGVAPGTTVYAVRVLDDQGRGTTSQLICGIDWVTANAARLSIRVASLSLGMPGSAAEGCGRSSADVLHRALCRSIAAGTVYVVAAGNDGADLAGFVPAGYPEVFAVTAMSDSDGAPGGRGGPSGCATRERDDAFASFSNYASTAADASHVIAAPGVCIRSAWKEGAYRTISGTSMAAPHVAATVALCIAAGACRGSAGAIIARVIADAAAHGAGFAGDARAPLAGRRYGVLVWAGDY